MKAKVVFVFLMCVVSLGYADVRLPKILGDNMVLQRNKPLLIWGWADPSEKVSVKFNKQTKTGKADKTGKWSIALDAEAAGGPFQLVVKGKKNTVTLSNILVGEVWVCSGQSNMEWPLRAANNAEFEIPRANYPEIRHFKVQQSVSSKPEDDVKAGDWKVCSPETVVDFTAVGYFFAREVYNKLKIPIGLIHTSWGGTHSETWTSREAFEKSPEFKDMIASMPELDLDELTKQKQDALTKRLQDLNISLADANVDKWKDLTLDDKQWPTMKLPGLWEDSGPGDVDGFVWFRKTVTLSAAEAGKNASLDLCMIDDSDETYVNGIKVGATVNKYNETRKYSVPVGVLKEGSNVIAIRVHDTGGDGGIYGDAKDMKLTVNLMVFSLDGDWRYNIERLAPVNSVVHPNSYPTLLFNAMINPLCNYGIAGVLWYQGEANAGRAYQYRTAFPLLITDWRSHWKQGDFPFYYVQLASFNANGGNSEKGSAWAELREAQTMTLSLPNTGMAVTTDIGEANDIHPRNKMDVGKRLAFIALNQAYGQTNSYTGPVYQSSKVEGSRIRISFFNLMGSSPVVKDKYGYIKGFEMAGADHKFKYAKAWLEGNQVVVAHEGISEPAAVRFGWADNPDDANLFNSDGLPATPFRSDNWQGITEGMKFKLE